MSGEVPLDMEKVERRVRLFELCDEEDDLLAERSEDELNLDEREKLAALREESRLLLLQTLERFEEEHVDEFLSGQHESDRAATVYAYQKQTALEQAALVLYQQRHPDRVMMR